ncbi:hypothetical protein FB45DRAFT_811717 [Roridomyces roridus]|uniref:Uncharacterized protein n=1 Tax=Roridomyces roridus TaxID=1738132 RepID=A0AAD7AYM6_9AGAR|nr:hypothetical protein FB45DRAFT_811717 [Roridomyces roridus]
MPVGACLPALLVPVDPQLLLHRHASSIPFIGYFHSVHTHILPDPPVDTDQPLGKASSHHAHPPPLLPPRPHRMKRRCKLRMPLLCLPQ